MARTEAVCGQHGQVPVTTAERLTAECWGDLFPCEGCGRLVCAGSATAEDDRCDSCWREALNTPNFPTGVDTLLPTVR